MSTNTNEQLTFGETVISDENTKEVGGTVVEQAEQPTQQPVQPTQQPVQPTQQPVQPTQQPMQPQPTSPIYTAPMGMKKPKKVGWIITLVFLILSLIGIVIGTGMAVSGVTSLTKSLDSEVVKKNEKPIENIGNGEFVVTSLESGKMYYVMSTITSGPTIKGMEVDGVTIGVEEAFQSAVQSDLSLSVYSFTATDTTASITLKGITDKTVGEIYVVDGEEYSSNYILIAAGGVVLFISALIAFISFILFVIFLTIFLTRNNKYKQSLR